MIKPNASIQLASTKDVITAHTPPDLTNVIQLKLILVPVDYSQESLRVLDYAILVAERFGAEVHPIHVRPQVEAMAVGRAGGMMSNYRDHISFLLERLQDIEHMHRLKFPPDHCHICSGRPFAEICKFARKIHSDLIILGSRGYSGLKRVLLGSTAERVIRFAPCPVLVPRGKRYKAAIGLTGKMRLKLRNILVPTDFSDCSAAAVDYAVFLAKKFKAKLKLVYSMQADIDFLAQSSMSGVLAGLDEADRLTAQNEMKEFTRLHIPDNMPCETEILTGDPVDQICAQSLSPELDLLIVSTHGRSGFQHALMGSVAEQVARYAECPVLTVPGRCAVAQ
jgi:nucleotide-binding universal stress UspA family protein